MLLKLMKKHRQVVITNSGDKMVTLNAETSKHKNGDMKNETLKSK